MTPGTAELVEIMPNSMIAKPAANVYGGMTGSGCTWGFSAKSLFNAKLLVTAAHCGNSQKVGGRATVFDREKQTGSYDVQSHVIPAGDTSRPWVHDNNGGDSTPYYRAITTIRNKGAIVVGSGACKYGKTTGYTCGTVASKSVSLNYIPKSAATFISVDHASVDQSEPGDSGGPVFSGDVALGIVSGHSEPGQKMYFMSVSYINDNPYHEIITN